MTIHLPRHLPLLPRLLAAMLAGVVLGLGVLAYAPAAHDHLHAGATDAEHSCAVVLFAHGVTAAGGMLLLVATFARVALLDWVQQDAPLPARIRRQPPACGPPRL